MSLHLHLAPIKVLWAEGMKVGIITALTLSFLWTQTDGPSQELNYSGTTDAQVILLCAAGCVWYSRWCLFCPLNGKSWDSQHFFLLSKMRWPAKMTHTVPADTYALAFFLSHPPSLSFVYFSVISCLVFLFFPPWPPRPHATHNPSLFSPCTSSSQLCRRSISFQHGRWILCSLKTKARTSKWTVMLICLPGPVMTVPYSNIWVILTEYWSLAEWLPRWQLCCLVCRQGWCMRLKLHLKLWHF